jgi:hypothetical protein
MKPALERFIERVHRLLQAGYETMTPRELAELNLKSEPDITRALAMQIQRLIDEGAVPGISRGWCVGENCPENLEHLPLSKQPAAKARKLPDLKFRYGGQREVLYFRFEAKKLAGTGEYEALVSWEEGLGRFLRRVYGRQDPAGGLLGYVQTETPQAHASRVETALTANPKKYRVVATGQWAPVQWSHGPKHCYRVEHLREGAAVIAIFYSFLPFSSPQRGPRQPGVGPFVTACWRHGGSGSR